jgi:hypothetical protein
MEPRLHSSSSKKVMYGPPEGSVEYKITAGYQEPEFKSGDVVFVCADAPVDIGDYVLVRRGEDVLVMQSPVKDPVVGRIMYSERFYV